MTQVLDRASLKSKFADGKKPTGEDFSDLIDTIAAGTPTATTVTTASKSAAIAGTDNTRPVTPAGVKAHVDERLANEGQATAGRAAPAGTNRWLMTPERTKQAIAAQVPAFVNAAKNTILGGVLSSYDTLKKLFDYINNSFYNRTQSDARYDRKTDSLAASRLSGTINKDRIPGLPASKLRSGTLSAAVKVQNDSVIDLDASKLTGNHNNITFQNGASAASVGTIGQPASRMATRILNIGESDFADETTRPGANGRIEQYYSSSSSTRRTLADHEGLRAEALAGTINKARIPKLGASKLTDNTQKRVFGNNAQFSYFIGRSIRPAIEGSWNVTLSFKSRTTHYSACEIIFFTGKVAYRSEVLVYNYLNTNFFLAVYSGDSVATTTITDPRTYNLTVPDNDANQDRLFCIRNLTAGDSHIKQVVLSHPATNVRRTTLNPSFEGSA